LLWVRDALPRAHFALGDVLRRIQGAALEALGLGPQECPYEIMASGPHWCLRNYGPHAASPSLLIVAAPIKRPYVWDLAPSVSAIRHCLGEGLHVYLLEWVPHSSWTEDNGLDAYADAILECVTKISGAGEGRKPFLIGHSLGGTLAAIFAALAPTSIQGLILLEAPLCFAPATSMFRDALVALSPPELSDTEPFPGSLLSNMAALAAPDIFVWSRMRDAFLSVSDSAALEIHARVERWILDEVSLPGKLVHQILQWLYRENRFCRGNLQIHETLVGPSKLAVPTLAVVNLADEVAPLASLKPCFEAMPVTDVRIIEYPGEIGVGLQHIGVLIGRQAHAKVWPEIMAWIKKHY
jgi:polyhydroxyalkanoate synthase